MAPKPVVTGEYDNIEDVLVGLGFPIRARYDNSTTPVIVNAQGNVDVIDGFSDFWVTGSGVAGGGGGGTGRSDTGWSDMG